MQRAEQAKRLVNEMRVVEALTAGGRPAAYRVLAHAAVAEDGGGVAVLVQDGADAHALSGDVCLHYGRVVVGLHFRIDGGKFRRVVCAGIAFFGFQPQLFAAARLDNHGEGVRRARVGLRRRHADLGGDALHGLLVVGGIQHGGGRDQSLCKGIEARLLARDERRGLCPRGEQHRYFGAGAADRFERVKVGGLVHLGVDLVARRRIAGVERGRINRHVARMAEDQRMPRFAERLYKAHRRTVFAIGHNDIHPHTPLFIRYSIIPYFPARVNLNPRCVPFAGLRRILYKK